MSFKKFFSIAQNKPKKKIVLRKEQITHSIGLTPVTLFVTFMARRTVTMTIISSGELNFKAPHAMTMEEVLKLLKSKESLILRKIHEYEKKSKNHITRSYEDGATHLLLGEKFTLSVIISKQKIAPKLENGILTLYAPSPEKVEIALKQWYRNSSIAVFSEIISPYVSDFMNKYGKMPNSIDYKYVKSYWGICTHKGDIRINIELMRAPKECVEYIIAHELCHLVQQNHSARFYQLLTQFMPDWKERKILLEKSISSKN